MKFGKEMIKEKDLHIKKYPKYKDSSIPWIGEIPEHWEVVRNKYLLKEINILSKKGNDEDLLTVSQYFGIAKRKEIIEEDGILTTAGSLEGYKIVKKNSLVMNIMLAWNGCLGVSNYEGITSPAYCVFSFNEKKAYPKYFHYLHRTKQYLKIFEIYSTGIIKSRLRLYPDKYLALYSHLPPLHEQEKIAQFLDKKTKLIDEYIQKKQKKIELLKELKKTIINDAVIGKINVKTGKPYPKYKETGLKWLPKIPEHWEVRKLRTIANILVSNVDKHIKENELPIRLCNYVDVYKNDEITNNINFMKATATKEEIEKFRIKKDDIIITKDSELWNDIAVPSFVSEDFKDVVCGYHLAIIRTKNKKDIFQKFLFYQFKSEYLQTHFRINATGIMRFGLSNYSIKIFPAILPPLPEQKAIAEYLDKKTKQIDQLIQKTQQEIKLIKEYKEKLIADATTGKIKVF